MKGNLPPEANLDTSTAYTAHTRGLNTGSIGVAVAAMWGAKEQPFKAGKYPITDAQVDAMAGLVARLCAAYDIPVRGDTVLTHAEVQPTLGVKQRGKWDINWLPGMDKAKSPHVAGERLRQLVREKMTPHKPIAAPVKPNPLAALIAALIKAFTRK